MLGGFEVREACNYIVPESSPGCSVEDRPEKAAMEMGSPFTG